MEQMKCQVELISPILDDIYNVVLTTPRPINYMPGQYLQVIMGEKDKRPFTIANASQGNRVELHIGATAGNRYAGEVIDQMRREQSVRIEIPLGSASIDMPPTRDVLIMVGGTGFSYAKALIEGLNTQQHSVQVYLYWGGRNLGGLYLYELAQQWDYEEKIKFYPVLEQPVAEWPHHVGLVHEAVCQDFPSMENLDVYVAGRFEMAATARDAFVAQGLPLAQLHGDAYQFI